MDGADHRRSLLRWEQSVRSASSLPLGNPSCGARKKLSRRSKNDTKEHLPANPRRPRAKFATKKISRGDRSGRRRSGLSRRRAPRRPTILGVIYLIMTVGGDKGNYILQVAAATAATLVTARSLDEIDEHTVAVEDHAAAVQRHGSGAPIAFIHVDLAEPRAAGALHRAAAA